jgi:Glycosyl hydrolases family 43
VASGNTSWLVVRCAGRPDTRQWLALVRGQPKLTMTDLQQGESPSQELSPEEVGSERGASMEPASGSVERSRHRRSKANRGAHAPSRRRGPSGVAVVVTLALIGAVCAGLSAVAFSSSDHGTTTTPTAQSAALNANAATLGAALATAAPGLPSRYYQPPASTSPSAPAETIDVGRDAPDPFIFLNRGTYYLFTSEGNLPTVNVPVRAATYVGKWGPIRDALPTLPVWAVKGFTWAPDVHRFGHHYVMYFTSIVQGSKPAIECIGDAISTKVSGPFIPGPHPFICQQSQDGSIDPRTFVDLDGKTYLVWKSDENANVHGTTLTNIYSQPLSSNGLSLLGQPSRIFGPDQPWQGRIVEAPNLVLVRGSYYLFFSGNWFNQPYYAIGVAQCSGPLGPCADPDSHPWLASNLQGTGPGEASVFSDRFGVWLVYNPFKSDVPNFNSPPRPVVLARLGFDQLGPYLANIDPLGRGGPTTSP